MTRALAFCLAALAAACASAGGPQPATPRGAAVIPATPLELGDWRRARPDAVAGAFARTVQERYGAGLALSAVSADLGRSQFACRAPNTDGRGDPPDQICRRTTRFEGCAHTWEVLLFGAGGRLARTRGAYDRVCRGDELLGGN